MTSPSETVINVDDPVEGEVVITGKPLEGGMLVANTERVFDEDGIASLSIGSNHQKMAAISKPLKQQAQAGLTCHKAW